MKRLMSIASAIAMILSLFTGCTGNIAEAAEKEQTQQDLSGIDSRLNDGNQSFAFEVFKQLNKEDEGQSVFISPFSISTALAMTYNGAAGSTRETMAEALRYKGIELRQLNDSYKALTDFLGKIDPEIQLNIGNSIWLRQDREVKQDFLSLNKSSFQAHIEKLDFSDKNAVDIINDWISNATEGKIDKLLEPPIPEDILMYIINAIYFKGQWSEPFDVKSTSEGIFNAGDGNEKKASMMRKDGIVEYGEVEGSKIVRLPYGNGKTAMYCILPEEGTPINDYVGQLSPEKWKELKDSLSKKSDVRLQLPKFELEYGIKNLNGALSALGMAEAFDPYKADFSEIAGNVSISRVLHKAVIEVNEEGSEAAAVTSVEMRLTSAVIDPITFIADRPFIFIIADDETGTILFMGKLYDV